MANSNRLANQAVFIDAGAGSMDVSSLFLPGQLGQVYTKNGKSYQVVQFKSTVGTIANGSPLIWTDKDDFVVSDKASDGKRNDPAGVALGTQTASYYGIIQVDGDHSAIATDTGSSASAGDVLIISGTDGKVDKITAGTAPTYIPLAVATGSTSANATAGTIRVPHNGW